MRIGVYKVLGVSMDPAIKSGSYVVYLSFHRMKFRIGCLYLFRHRLLGVMVKRMVKDLGTFYLFEGDNPLSISSCKIGEIQKKDILGQVLVSVSPGLVLPKIHRKHI